MTLKRSLFLVLIALIFSSGNAQEIRENKIKTTVSDVTVFLEDAQITRKKALVLQPGKTILKFHNLSPFIDAKSVQVHADGDVTILSVNHQQNFIDKLEKRKELLDLENKLQKIEDAIVLESTYLKILKEELAFLKENRNIGGSEKGLSVVNFKEAALFYGTKLKELKLKEIEIYKRLKSLKKEKLNTNKQIGTISGKKEFPNGEILVKVETTSVNTSNFELTYVVKKEDFKKHKDFLFSILSKH